MVRLEERADFAEFRRWWHRRGKAAAGGSDLADREAAESGYREWERQGPSEGEMTRLPTLPHSNVPNPLETAFVAGDEERLVAELRNVAAEKSPRTARANLVLRILDETFSSRVRNAAALALADMHCKSAKGSLIRLLSRPNTKGSRGTLLYTLGELGAELPLPVLADVVVDESYEAREEALDLIRRGCVEGSAGDLAKAQARLHAALASADEERSQAIHRALEYLRGDPRARPFIIRAALKEESNNGWIWLGGPCVCKKGFLSRQGISSRTIVKIRRPRRLYGVICEVRTIDFNFRGDYNEDPKNKRIKVERNLDTMVVPEWYRTALGIERTNRENGDLTELIVTKLKFWGWRSLRAACHHPDLVARIGARLGVIGTWLGLLALADLLLKLYEHFDNTYCAFGWLRHLRVVLGVSEHSTDVSAYMHTCVMIAFALVTLAVFVWACWGRPQPRRRPSE
jgi:hypothetical protein